MTTKDWLEIVVIPVSLALVALAWPWIQRWNHRLVFMNLIIRELKETRPFEPEVEKGSWSAHLTKTFVHQRIFREPSANREFLLSLHPDLTYFVSQLWDAHARNDKVQWLNYLQELVPYDRSGELCEILQEWQRLCAQYEPSRTGALQDAV